MKIIGFGNKARQGKDYTAERLLRLLGDKCIILHFADALYKELQQDTPYGLIYPYWLADNQYCIFDKFSDRYIPTYTLVQSEELTRIFKKRQINRYYKMEGKDAEMLQWWGTNYRRAQDPDYWIKKLDEKLCSLDNSIEYVLIPDTRFKNEYKYIKNNGGLYVKVIATVNGEQYIDPSRPANHQSEIDLDNIEPDYIIQAEKGNLEELNSAIEKFYHYLTKNAKSY